MIYRKSSFGHQVNSGGHRERLETTGGVPGVHRVGPPIPVGPLGRKGEVASPNGLAHHMGLPLHAPRVETLGGGGAPMPWGARIPPWPPPHPADPICRAGAPPWPPIYMWGGEGSRTIALAPLPLPSQLRLLNAGRPAKPCCDLHCIRHHAVVLPDL